MTIVDDVRKVEVEKLVGRASTISAEEFKPVWADVVERFLREHEKSLGNNCVRQVGGYLYNGFRGVDPEGNLTGSGPYIGVAIATLLPEINLIKGRQLLELYLQKQRKNPFGNVLIDFGVLINGEKVNPVQARILLEEMKKRSLEIGEGVVPDFCQLRLCADENAGLVYKLADEVTKDNLTSVSVYPFQYVGKEGLFRAYLNRGGDWYADDEYLAISGDDGRVVKYDAEGITPKKLKRDLVSILKDGFLEI